MHECGCSFAHIGVHAHVPVILCRSICMSLACFSYSPGVTFSPNVCTTCRCEFDKTFGDRRYGNAICSITDCPKLKCISDGVPISMSGECCPVCAELTKCPAADIVAISLGATQNCAVYIPEWSATETRFCWALSNDHVQTSTLTLLGSNMRCQLNVTVVGKL